MRETRSRFACRDELQGVAAGPDLSRPTSTPWQASVLREGEIGIVLVAQTRRQPAQQWKAEPDCGLRLEFASTEELEHTHQLLLNAGGVAYDYFPMQKVENGLNTEQKQPF